MDGVLHALLNIINITDSDETYHMIALILIQNINTLSDMSITEIADLCFVSPSTLSRFLRDIGFNSFSSFKESLGKHYGFEIDYNDMYLNTKMDPARKLKEFQNQVVRNLEDMNETISYSALYDLVKMIHDNKEVIFFGYTFYQHVFLYLQQRLSLFNKIIFANPNIVKQAQTAEKLTDQSLAIIYSPRGHSMVNNGVVNTLYKNKVPTILLTQNNNPPFASRYTKIIHLGGSPENNMSVLSILYLIDQIIMVYYTLYHDELII